MQAKRDMRWRIEQLSNHRLEDEIARIYQAAEGEVPGIKLKETGVLSQLWEEVDDRLRRGDLT